SGIYAEYFYPNDSYPLAVQESNGCGANGVLIAMKRMNKVLCALLFATLSGAFAPPLLHAQASDLPNATTTQPSPQTQEQRGRQLMDQMVAALGGDAWL